MKPFPAGTIRDWEGGTFIKACEPSKYNHSGWIPLQTSQALESIGRECDSLASSCLSKKEPIAGEIALDHEIDNFEKDANGDHPYTANDFKKYEGFYGSGRYSFRNEFSRRFMAEKLALQEAINKAYDDAMPSNAMKGLDAATKKEIRNEVKANFNYNYEPFKTTQANELKGIIERTKKQLDIGFNFEGEQKKVYDEALSVVKSLPLEYDRIAKKRKQKEDALKAINEIFKDNWGAREAVKKKLDDAYGEYVRKFSDQIREGEGKSQEETFGVTIDEPYETFYPKLFDKIQLDRNKFNKYKVEDIELDKYEGEEIALEGISFILKKDKNGHLYLVRSNQISGNPKFNIDAIKDHERLYPQGYLEIDNRLELPVKQGLVDKLNMFDLLSQHIGEEIETITNSHYGKSKNIYKIKKDKENKIYLEDFVGNRKNFNEYSKTYSVVAEQLHKQSKSYPFNELLYLRFETLYSKQFDGDWNESMLPVIYNIEKLLNTLPLGHAINNGELNQITNKEYGDNNGYAWYSSNERRINFSDKAANAFSIWGDLKGSQEFNSVVAHEIGHAVSYKLGRKPNLNYRKFGKECGWDWSYLRPLGDDYIKTGDQKGVERTGSESHQPLLTAYAETSPEEAFAEYYSIYVNNKEAIDSYLATNNKEFLCKVSKIVAQSKPDSDLKNVKDYSGFQNKDQYKQDKEWLANRVNKRTIEIPKEIENLHLQDKKNFDVELINPWMVKFDKGIKEEAEYIKTGLYNARINEPHPIVVIQSKTNIYHCLRYENYCMAFKRTHKMAPALIISEEAYSQLSQKFTKEEIIDYAIYFLRDRKVPLQNNVAKFKKGLEYRNEVLSVEDLVHNKNRFLAMKKIFDSPSLQKALKELFGLNHLRDVFAINQPIQDNALELQKSELNSILSELEENALELNLVMREIDSN